MTTNLSIIYANFVPGMNPGTGELTCMVTPAAPLWIKELIIEAYPNLPIPTGILKPGTKDHPVVRTIFVDSNDQVFRTPAPFTLAVTYDENYRLTAPVSVVAGGVVQPAIAFS